MKRKKWKYNQWTKQDQERFEFIQRLEASLIKHLKEYKASTVSAKSEYNENITINLTKDEK
jgi:hypothetical protein